MRRGPGLAALDRSAATSQQYNSLSSELTSSQLTELHAQLDTFSSALRNFAARHRGDIKRDANFRHAFQQMCAAIGVDPLGGRAGPGGLVKMWNDVLGLGDWQYELGIQIIDVCVSTRPYNGGLIRLDDLIRAVMHSRGKKQGEEGEITEKDIVRSIAVLKPLGSGYEVIDVAGTKMIRSIPRELDTDTSIVLGFLSVASSSTTVSAALVDGVGNRFVTEDSLLAPQPSLSKPVWSRQRARAILDDLSLGQGILWIDEQAHPARYYSLLGQDAGGFSASA